MTVCYGIWTCGGTWDFFPFLMLLSLGSIILASWWRKWALIGFAVLLIPTAAFSREVLAVLLSPIVLYEMVSDWRFGSAAIELLRGLLWVVPTILLAVYAPKLKERYGMTWLYVLAGVAFILIILFALLIRQEMAAEALWMS